MTDGERERLLIDFHLGELDEMREEEVRNALADSADWREKYREISGNSLYLRWLQRDEQIDEAAALKRLSAHWSRKTVLWRRYAAIASVVLLAGFSFFILTTRRAAEQEGIASCPEILPGSSRAVLIVSSGEQIALSGQEEVIREADGTTIHIEQTGQISYVRNAEHTSVSDDAPLFHTILVPRGGEYLVVLPDSSKVWLNSESELRYPVRFDSERRVELEGEAYFEVRKDERPFLVHADDFRLKVYGTEFNLNTYDRESPEVVLVKGSVGFGSARAGGETLLRPDQAGKINLKTGAVCVKEVDVYPYIAWKNHDMVFFNETLERIMEKTSRWYNIEVVYDDPGLKELRFSADIKRYAGIETFLGYLEKTAEIECRIRERTLHIRRK